MLLLLVVVSLLLPALVIAYVSKSHQYWSRRNVFQPSDGYSPLFGHIKDHILLKKTMGAVIKRIYDAHPNERLLGLYSFTSPQLLVRDLDDVRRIFISDFNYFQDRYEGSNKGPALLRNISTMGFEEWKPTRQRVTPAFTSGKLGKMFHLIRDVGEGFAAYIGDIVEEVEARELMSKFTMDVIGSCAFGLNLSAIADDGNAFRKMSKAYFCTDGKKFVKRFLSITFPRLFAALGLCVEDEKIVDFFQSTIERIVAEKQATASKRHDFVDLMLELKQKDDKNPKENVVQIDNEFIAAQAFVFFLAGFETSTNFMAFALHELVFHREIQERLHAEIVTTVAQHGGDLTYEAVKDMKYLDMFFDEVQRLHPIGGVILRTCTQPYTFHDSKIHIEKGAKVMIPIEAIHLDPNYYPRPYEFDPERFSPEIKRTRHPMAFLPFGEGPRNCIGLRFAKLQSKMGLITLLKDFIVEPCSKTREQIELDPASFISNSKHGIWIKIKKRSI